MIRVFDMFSGYGGALFSLKKANIPFSCVGFSEVNNAAIEFYELNHGVHTNFGDCQFINPASLPDFDLLTGGFPCQDVSYAGLRDLSRGRTLLFNDILRIAEVKKPKFMLLENVKGLRTVNKGKLFRYVVKSLEKLGYGVAYKLLNSCDFGVPQNRERYWFVCKLGGWDFAEFQFPYKVKLENNLLDLVEDFVHPKYFVDKKWKAIVKRASKRGKIPKVNPLIASCLLCRHPSRNYSEATFVETKQKVRILIPKECFRLMGFKDDEVNLKGFSDTQLYRLAGNGWDINVASKILKGMIRV